MLSRRFGTVLALPQGRATREPIKRFCSHHVVTVALSPVRDDLVAVHVRLCPAARLKHNQREVVVQLSLNHLPTTRGKAYGMVWYGIVWYGIVW